MSRVVTRARPSLRDGSRRLLRALAIALAVLPGVNAQELLITELVAVNDDTLLDEDGESSDWFEVQNTSGARLDLDGWFATDEPGVPGKWRFPAVELGAGEFLVVFASAKDRAVAGEELHTSFRLGGTGEYLAVNRPDGSVSHEYAPGYPEQRRDYSYGIAQTSTTTVFVTTDSAARINVPVSGADGMDWTLAGFDDGDWTDGTAAVGYDTEEPVGNPGDAINVASAGEATQSSTLGSFRASLGIDGNLGNFTHTAAGVNTPATWEVDLGRVTTIGSVVLHNRSGCCGSRLRDITVIVLDAPGGEIVWRSGLLNPENVLGGGGTAGPAELTVDILADVGGPVGGRVVRVVRTPDPDLSGTGGAGNSDEADVLSLAEVEVLEVPLLGYHGLIGTDLEDGMSGLNASAYIRIPFELDEARSLDLLELRMKYDDGFVAYLNGREVARTNAPASPVWSSTASRSNSDTRAVVFEDFVITDHQDALEIGTNLLAIHGMNSSAGSSDFLIVPELLGRTIVGDAPRYFRTPTPAEPNDLDSFEGFVSDTTFSVDRGFHEAPFDVEITTLTEGATIRYTLDGNRPTATIGRLYDGPIPVDVTTTLCAAAFKDGFEPTNVDCHTYLFLDDIVRQDVASTRARGFPAAWGGASADYGMDPDVVGQDGQDRYGGRYAATIRDDLRAIPTLSIVMDIDEMFGSRGIYTNSTSRGRSWERACSMELIHADGRSDVQVNCGIRIHGGAFRSHGLTKKHSLRLLFKSDYGPTKLRYPIFGGEIESSFDTITLRANSNDGWQWGAAGALPLYIRDSFGRETMLAMDNVASHETFVHLYINGVYWGLYNPVERPDSSFSATYWGGDKDDWDALSNGQASSGSWDGWNAMLGVLRGGVEDYSTYMRAQGKNPDGTDNPAFTAYVDVENVVDYAITNLYVGNTDWPHKNYWIGFNPVEPSGFKYYMWDSEWSLGLRSNLNTNQTTRSNGVMEPYSLLRRNEEFRVFFGDRLHAHFSSGGALHVDPENSAWDPGSPEDNVPAARMVRLAGVIERAIVAESARWGDQHASTSYTRDEDWAVELANRLATYFPRRSNVVLEQFRSGGLYPQVDAPVLNRHGGFIESGFELTMRASSGQIYYTIDGEDPRNVGGGLSAEASEGSATDETVLIDEGDPVRVLVPTSGDLGLEWIETEFDDSGWQSGTTGVGYEDGSGYEDLINTDVGPDANDTNATVYIRLEFDGSGVTDSDFLGLAMKYDDGFIAYLNGVRVASANAPENPTWSSTSAGSHSDSLAVVYEPFDITAFAPELRDGINVLVIHGLNTSTGSSDLLILPRLVASSVRGGGIILDGPARVKARALLDGEWSALSDVQFVIDTPLRITEIMYHPAPPDAGIPFGQGDMEFIELENVSGRTIDLSGISIAGGIRFDFSAGAVESLGPGQVVVLVENLAAFATRYNVGNILIAGEFSGQLDNLGESLRLIGPHGERILDFEFDDRWHPLTDGSGPSLVIVDPFADRDTWGRRESWRSSDFPFGSPGVDESDGGEGGRQRPGDTNQDSRVDISDVVALLRHLFADAAIELPCGDGSAAHGGNIALLDFNGDDAVDVTDAINQLSYLFAQGPPHALGSACRRVPECPEGCGA